jgi:hypothetical protein
MEEVDVGGVGGKGDDVDHFGGLEVGGMQVGLLGGRLLWTAPWGFGGLVELRVGVEGIQER